MLLVFSLGRPSGRAYVAAFLMTTLAAAPTSWAVERTVWHYPTAGSARGARPLEGGQVLVIQKDIGELWNVVPVLPSGGTTVRALSGFFSPDYARVLPNGDVLMADTVANKVRELDADGGSVLTFGSGAQACSDTTFNYPSDALRLTDGGTLIVDQANQRLLELARDGSILWRYGDPSCVGGSASGQLSTPFSVDLMPNGDVLVADVANQRVVQLHPTPPVGGQVVWTYGTMGIPGSGPNQLSSPPRAVRLANGNILISDAGNHRVLEVTPTLPSGGTIVWQYGTTGAPGSGPGFLNAPYDAQRLPNLDTLIAERDGQQVRQISPPRLQVVSPLRPLREHGCSDGFTVEVADSTGASWTVPTDTQVQLATTLPSAQLYADAACTVPLGPLTVPSGAAAAPQAVYLRTPVPGEGDLSVSSSAYPAGSVHLSVGLAATKLLFTSTPQSILHGSCSASPLTLRAVDDAQRPVVLTPAAQVTLGADSPSLVFSLDPDCSKAVSQLSLGDVASLYARDVVPGTHQVTAQVAGLAPAAQPFIVLGSSELRVGCGCSASDAPDALPLMLLAMLLVMRKR